MSAEKEREEVQAYQGRSMFSVFLDMLDSVKGSFTQVKDDSPKKVHTSGRRELARKPFQMRPETAKKYVESGSGIRRKDKL